ncbi:hypothetical protein HK405_006854, partial [Cladochytrium tenue]
MGVLSLPAHLSARRLAAPSGTSDLMRTFVLQLGTCGALRTRREALLLLESMVNANELVDVASFHAHVTANPDVERVFVNRLGIALKW